MPYDWTGGATLSPYQQQAAIPFSTSGGGGGKDLLGGALGLFAGPVIGALSSLFAPNKEKQAQKNQLELMEKQNQYGIEGEQRKLDRINKYTQPSRKQTDISKNLPQLNDLFTRLVAGLGKESFGGDRSKDWGIDWNSLFSGLQQTTPGGSYNEPAAPNVNMGGGLRDNTGGRIPMDVSQYGQYPPMGDTGSMLRMGTGGGGANPNMYTSALMKKYGMEA